MSLNTEMYKKIYESAVFNFAQQNQPTLNLVLLNQNLSFFFKTP